jgi:hypothetical protein
MLGGRRGPRVGAPLTASLRRPLSMLAVALLGGSLLLLFMVSWMHLGHAADAGDGRLPGQLAGADAAAAAAADGQDNEVGWESWAASPNELQPPTGERLEDNCTQKHATFSRAEVWPIEGGPGYFRMRVSIDACLSQNGSNPRIMWGRPREEDKFENVVEYKEPLEFENEELVVAVCDFMQGSGKSAKLEPQLNVYYRNVPRPELYRRARQRQRALERAGSRALLGLNVVVLQMDAVSRLHFLRSLPRSDAFLRELDEAGDVYRVFNFSGLNVVGYDSVENFPTLYSGFRYDLFLKQFHDVNASLPLNEWRWSGDNGAALGQNTRNQSAPDGTLLRPNTWLWDLYRSRGYVTLHGDELCTPKQTVAKFFGSAEPADVRVGNAYCTKTYCCCCVKWVKLCVGERASFRRSLDYLLQFAQNYRGVGRFATFNMLLGHEPTMEQLRGLDEPLLRFLRSALLYEPHDLVPVHRRRGRPETVLVLLSDHGLQYGAYSHTRAGQLEHKNPPLFVVLPRWVADRYPELERNLRANQDAFITGADVYAMLARLPVYPDPVDAPPWAFDLMSSAVPRQRTCTDARVPTGYCAREEWSTVSVKGLNQHITPELQLATLPPTAPLLVHLAAAAVNYVNHVIDTAEARFPRVCHRLALVSVPKAQHSALKGQMRLANMSYAGGLRFDSFKLFVNAAPEDRVAAKIAARDTAAAAAAAAATAPSSGSGAGGSEARHVNEQNEEDPNEDRDVVTFEVILTVPPDPEEKRLDLVVFDPDTLVISSVNRVSRRAPHEACMRPRDPRIPAAYCV